MVNNSPLGNFAAFEGLRRRLSGRVALEIQDGAPVDPESYYHGLFDAVDDFRGLILAPFVIDTVGMDHGGGYPAVDWDPFATANRIVQVARRHPPPAWPVSACRRSLLRAPCRAVAAGRACPCPAPGPPARPRKRP